MQQVRRFDLAHFRQANKEAKDAEAVLLLVAEAIEREKQENEAYNAPDWFRFKQ